MNRIKPQKQKNIFPLHELIVYIVGYQRMQNELIAHYLENKIGVTCFVGEDINNSLSTDDSQHSRHPRLCLWDCKGKNLQGIFIELKLYKTYGFSQHHAALFNMSHDLGIEEKCLRHGVRGFFYEEDPLSRFLTGVCSICEGKLWISENIMAKYILTSMNPNLSMNKEDANLTPRQIEVLTLIAEGVSNKDIAKRLCISTHTVKTHLYTIFQTINVSNRIQAATWTTKYLRHLVQEY